MIQMKVSAQEAKQKLSQIGHEKFQQGFSKHWKYKTGTAQATAQSICWLYCWAEAEGGSYKRAGELAREAFNYIFDPPNAYDWLRKRPRFTLKVARHLRYKKGDIEREFNSYL